MKNIGKAAVLTPRNGATTRVGVVSGTETELQKSILKALSQAGYWAFRVNSGTRNNGRVKLAPNGTPDICCVSPPGWIEVKLPGQTLRPEQVEWHERARRQGVRVATVTGTLDALVWAGDWTRQDALRAGLAVNLKRIAEEMSDV